MRVLVAEDRPRMARLLERALRNEGHSVVLAYNGEQALISGRSPDLDVILLDVMLPVMDGFAVLRNLRAETSQHPNNHADGARCNGLMWCEAWIWALMII